MGNVGHFDNEISKTALEAMSVSKERVRDFVEEYRMADGRRLYLIAEGRLMNLAAGQGHPAEIMDMSFSTQALGLIHMVKNYKGLAKGVHNVPEAIDQEIARIKLESMGVEIDALTEEQLSYIGGWEEGT